MGNVVFAVNGKIQLFILLLISCCMLFGCASSNVSRDAAANFDHGVNNAKRMADNAADTSIADTYQNSSQMTKGALIGGVAGAVTGSVTSIGVLPGTAIGAILGASYGGFIDSQTTLEDKLENRGANIIVLGDQILIVIPSDRIFDPWTSNIKPQAYSTLALVTQYINRYVKTMVKVSSYTSNTGSRSLDAWLSEQQAQKVSKALQAAGIDARLMYAQGYGGSRLVTANTGEWESDNYRIEITLEKLYV